MGMQARDIFDKACRDLGLEHPATIAIGKYIDAYRCDAIDYATTNKRCKEIYDRAKAL